MIWREKQNHSAWIQQRRVKRDIQVTITVAFVILSFLVSWMPYAVVSLLEGFFQIDVQGVSPMLVQLPCLMAKTACIWNPIVYVCHNSRYRKAYIETFSFLRVFSERVSTEDETLANSSDSKEKSFRGIKTQSVISKV
ncbi:7 transmembrane receptor (rhodopsin) [Mactra antiquata]